jgi:hypothetical protein
MHQNASPMATIILATLMGSASEKRDTSSSARLQGGTRDLKVEDNSSYSQPTGVPFMTPRLPCIHFAGRFDRLSNLCN